MPPRVLSPQSGRSAQLHIVVKGQTQGFMQMQSDAGGDDREDVGSPGAGFGGTWVEDTS